MGKKKTYKDHQALTSTAVASIDYLEISELSWTVLYHLQTSDPETAMQLGLVNKSLDQFIFLGAFKELLAIRKIHSSCLRYAVWIHYASQLTKFLG